MHELRRLAALDRYERYASTKRRRASDSFDVGIETLRGDMGAVEQLSEEVGMRDRATCFLPERTQFDQPKGGWRKSGSCSFLPERTQFRDLAGRLSRSE